MRRKFTTSVLFAALFAVSAVGQEPAVYREKVVIESDWPFPFLLVKAQQDPAPKTAKTDTAGKTPDKGDAKKADPTDAAVAAALANDPDVKIARAKLQLAEAETAKAKQAVVMKVMALVANIKELKAAVEQNQERAEWADRMAKSGLISREQAQADRARLESSRSALVKAETELKLLTGSSGKEVGPGGDPDSADKSFAALAAALEAARRREDQMQYAQSILAAHAAWLKAPAGAIPDRIRAGLDKPVKIGPKGEKVPFDKALEVFKSQAGFDVPIRPGLPSPLPEVTSQGEEMPLGAWLQLYQDISENPFTFYVREYGLLVANKATAPPDAPTLTAFWKQKPPAKTETAPEPKPGK